VAVLDSVAQIAKDTPPVDNAGSRFGNPAFKTFYDKLKEVFSHAYHMSKVCQKH
jgi:serine/threonine-protein phosphatase 2A activator